MNFFLRKGPEYTSSSQLFTLEELEAKIRAREIEPNWLCRGERESEWKEVRALISVRAEPEAKQESPTVSKASDVPSDMDTLLKAVLQNQAEQIRLLRAIRWAIVGFSIWFIIQFWFLPRLLVEFK